MAFITDNDYDVQTQADVRKLLDGSDDKKAFRQAENYAKSQIRLRLAGRYDCDKIFSMTGDAREPYIVMIAIDIAVYHLYSKKSPRQIPEYRQIRYDDAMDWLKDVGNGTTPTDLPPIPTDQFKGDIRLGSLYKPNNHKY